MIYTDEAPNKEDGYERIANTEAFEAGIGSVAELVVGNLAGQLSELT